MGSSADSGTHDGMPSEYLYNSHDWQPIHSEYRYSPTNQNGPPPSISLDLGLDRSYHFNTACPQKNSCRASQPWATTSNDQHDSSHREHAHTLSRTGQQEHYATSQAPDTHSALAFRTNCNTNATPLPNTGPDFPSRSVFTASNRLDGPQDTMDAGRDTLTVSPSQMRFNPTDADDLSQTHNVTRNDQHDSSHGEHARSLSHNAAFSFKAPLRPPDPLRTWQSLNVSTPVPDNLRRDSMHPKFEGNTGWEGNARLDEDIGLEGVAGMEGVTRLDGVARSDRATGLEPGTGLEASSSTTPPTGRRRRSEYAEPGSARAIYLEKNRKAASKCRSKQKMEQEALVEKAREADRRNRLLKQEVELLQGELRNLKELVGQHSDCADNRLQQWVQGEADRLASAGYRPEYRFNAGLGRSTSSTTHVPPRQPY